MPKPGISKEEAKPGHPLALVKSLFTPSQTELSRSFSEKYHFQKLFCMLLSPDVWGVTIRNVSCQDIIEEITADYIREKMWSAPEDMLLRFQATSSGPRLRKEFEARKAFLYDQEEHVVKIQVCESPTTCYRKLSCSLEMFCLIIGPSATSIRINKSACGFWP